MMMRRNGRSAVLVLAAGLALAGGCPDRGQRGPTESAERIGELYEPVGLEVLPGTQPISSRGTGRYDQLRVVLALYNHQQDRDRGFGTFRFEVYEYRKASADRRGKRWGFWEVTIDSRQDLEKYWDSFNRMYEFRLDCQSYVPSIQKAVLEVTYRGLSKRRLSTIKVLDIPRPTGLAGQG